MQKVQEPIDRSSAAPTDRAGVGHDMNRDWSDLFPILSKSIFFDHAGVAPISGPAADALRTYAEQAATHGYVGAGWTRRLDQIKRQAARLIGADSADEIAFVANTSSGLSMVARGLPFRAGDDVVITNVEYPANRYPWQDLGRLGVRLIEVAQLEDGRIDVEDVCEAITDRTRVVAISHVQYASGHRVALKPIADMVHRAGGYLCVDAIQSVGALPVDVRSDGIDFLAADGHKWLLGPEGCGIFYCRAELIEMLHPPIVGWMCMEDHTNYGDYRFEFARTGRRFEPGSSNVPGALALGASMDLLLEIGIESVWTGIERLTARLERGLAERGYRLFSPRVDSAERSGLVIFDPPVGGPGADEVLAHLRPRGIHLVAREGRLRASPHFYNTLDQVDRLIEAMP